MELLLLGGKIGGRRKIFFGGGRGGSGIGERIWGWGEYGR